MKEFEGIIPYLVSPIRDDGSVNESELKRLANDLVDKGVSGLCALGSCGEFAYLTLEQKECIVRSVVDVAQSGGVVSLAGVCGFSEVQAVREAELFASLGVDGIVLMIETYFPLSDEMVAHFIRTVSESVPDIQVVIYSNPKYMHFRYSVRIFELISNLRNVNYYKDASGDTGFLMTLTNRFGSRFKLFSASAHVPLFVFELGGKGWMSGPSCVIPEESVRLYALYKEGRIEEALQLQRKLWDVNRMFAQFDLTPCLKAMLRYKGYDVGYPVPPLKDISTEAVKQVARVLDNLQEK